MLDVKSMNNDAKFDSHLKFGDKKASRCFSKHGSIQDVDATDEVADGVLISSTGLTPVDHEKWRRN